jgi:CubicO group peptidase (beta-lactamase class C family)
MKTRPVLVTILLGAACFAQNPEARMDQIVASYAAKQQFMGTALVARGSDVIFSKGYGSANVEWNLPNTPSTKFRVGSVTKQFTAAAILLLEERGKLKVDDPVKQYIPNAPAAWGKITIFNLLTHTSGIPNFTAFADVAAYSRQPTTAEKNVAHFMDKPLDFQPGERWSYSNSGYIVLQYLIEKLSGASYEAFLQENIFTPLGMKDSGYDVSTAILPRRASGYQITPNGLRNAEFVDMTTPGGAGALYSTTEDLLKWTQGLFGGKLLSAASLQKMTTPFKNDYAFGLGVRTVNGRKIIEHNGGIQGFTTQLTYYPAEKLTVAVLCNSGGPQPGEIADQLATLALGGSVVLQSERKEITLDPAVLARYAGAYKMDPPVSGIMMITAQGGALTSQLTGQAPIPLLPQSETIFFAQVVNAQIEFPPTPAGGHAAQITLHQNGQNLNGTRLDDAESRSLLEAAATTTQRIKDQTADPGSQAALRRLIEEIRTGKPDYSRMSDPFAAATRQQLSQIQAALVQLGAVQTVTFKGVGPAGNDIYQVKFENGLMEYRIGVSAGGRIEAMNARALNP